MQPHERTHLIERLLKKDNPKLLKAAIEGGNFVITYPMLIELTMAGHLESITYIFDHNAPGETNLAKIGGTLLYIAVQNRHFMLYHYLKDRVRSL